MLKLQERRDLADKLLVWLKTNKLKRWNNNHDVFLRFSNETNEQMFNVWKAYELLRNVGRLGLNNPAGRKGGYIISFTPLSKPAQRELNISKIKTELLKRILEDLRSQFAREWDDALKEIERQIVAQSPVSLETIGVTAKDIKSILDKIKK